jgi:putative DNA primase/helicase
MVGSQRVSGDCFKSVFSRMLRRYKLNYTLMVEAIAAAGLGAPDIIHDKQIHRFTSPDDRPGSNNCWYVSYGTAGKFGSWKLGFDQVWSDGKAENNAQLLEEIREYQRHRKADQELKWSDIAVAAREFFYPASKIIEHAYPANKKITHYNARQAGNTFMIPMYFNGELVNVQKIYPDGTKRYMKGARKTGCYMPMGDLTDHIHICEGYATGCSLHDLLPAVCVAFDAGNLKPVALSIRKKYPKVKITIGADNDINTDGNPGLTKARQAAAAVGGDVIYPDFSDENFSGTDYNDYLTQGGKL